MTFTTRQAGMEDLSLLIQILQDGRDFQRVQGFVQWGDAFPDEEELIRLIEAGEMFLFLADQEPAGCFQLTGQEPVYGVLPGNAKVLHKTALSRSFAGQGLSRAFFGAMKKTAHADSIWIDTHPDNERMQHVLKREGFVYVKPVIYPVGLRWVYQYNKK